MDNLDNFKKAFFRTSGNLSAKTEVDSWKKDYDKDFFRYIIGKTHPKKIIEVGSFVGYSAINMLNECQNNNLDTEIVCIDTWLGGIDHYLNEDKLFSKYFDIQKGISGIFDKFLENVSEHGYKDRVIPIPNTSSCGYKILKNIDYQSDITYIDASHEYEDVIRDIQMFQNLTKKSGAIFGHDFNWDQVQNAVMDYISQDSAKFKK